MSEKRFKDEIVLYLESKIKEENSRRDNLNNSIHSYTLEGIETNRDAVPEIMNSIQEYYTSEHVTGKYYELIKFIDSIDYS